MYNSSASVGFARLDGDIFPACFSILPQIPPRGWFAPFVASYQEPGCEVRYSCHHHFKIHPAPSGGKASEADAVVWGNPAVLRFIPHPVEDPVWLALIVQHACGAQA
mmetsp:Transcript_137498/g.343047  ORF Transcript_137498/g.343047 Transcript_137498/m.343047 type:complete len:107 (+) Transcript_137498:633-953(+)